VTALEGNLNNKLR